MNRSKPHRIRTAVPKATYLQSQETSHGRQNTAHVLNSLGMRKEMFNEWSKAQKRKAGKYSLHMIPELFSLPLMLEATALEEAQKFRRLDIAHDVDLDDEDLTTGEHLSAQGILDGSLECQVSHVGGEFLQILLDDSDSTSG